MGNAFGFLLTDTSRLFRQYFEKTVAENGLGLTPGEIRALGHVIRFRGSRQAILAERMGVEPMTLSAYLDRLEARKLIHRTMDPNDRRAKLIEPTEDAFRIMRELDPLFDKIYAYATQGLSEGQIREVGEALKIIRSNLTTDPQLEEPVNLLCTENPLHPGSGTA
ncbi:MarR family winged helix-turn-helix transcriptional regulator [Aureimonas sp. SK2]|uniref:MarR family winged helix-turn-helix transcriptional regulator n=1 Tax=Aureimonas sp. SK2 TaxID=3015992 RepID=UPI002443B773|nr:MarR family winged helix-turn-helix transcriptional regulator [Aureimonas sp. SK2]